MDNLLALEIQIEEYMEENEIDDTHYEIKKIISSLDGYQYVVSNDIDILFLDIMMPKLDGLSFLKALREETDIHQPIVVMATALDSEITLAQEQKYGANAYMVKPISYKVVSIMMKRYLKILEEDSFDVENEFEFDFDFDEFDEAEDQEEKKMPTETIEECINTYGYTPELLQKIISKQNSYQEISAEQLLKEYDWNRDALETQIEDLEYTIFKIFSSLETDIKDQDINIEEDFENIIYFVLDFKSFVQSFQELKDLEAILIFLIQSLDTLDISTMDENQKMFANIFIKAIISDFIDLKDNLFVNRDASSIYYLNASMASSCLELDTFLKGL